MRSRLSRTLDVLYCRAAILGRHWRRNPVAGVEVAIFAVLSIVAVGIGFADVAGDFTPLLSAMLGAIGLCFAAWSIGGQWRMAVIEDLREVNEALQTTAYHDRSTRAR